MFRAIFPIVFLTASSAASAQSPEAAAVAEGASIAAAVSRFDVAGIKLGVPIDQAVAQIQNVNPRLKVIDRVTTTVWPQDRNNPIAVPPPNAPKTMSEVRAEVQEPGGGAETVEIRSAVHPNSPVVVFVNRSLSYPMGKGPASANLLAGLKQKYGEPSKSDPTSAPSAILRWYFDEQGQLLRADQAKQVIPGCAAQAQVNASNGKCASLTVIDAFIGAMPNGAVTNLNVTIASHRLTIATDEATDQFLIRTDAERTQQQQRDSGSRPVPKL